MNKIHSHFRILIMIEHISFFYVSFLVLSSWERILKPILIYSYLCIQFSLLS